MIYKECILEENKKCNGCLKCDYCDLDSSKICDNCKKCLDLADYNGLGIEKIDMKSF